MVTVDMLGVGEGKVNEMASTHCWRKIPIMLIDPAKGSGAARALRILATDCVDLRQRFEADEKGARKV